MKAKNVLYAAVGAPVVAARKVGERASELRGKLNEQASGYGETAGKAIDDWASEGERLVDRVTDGKVVDELTGKVDLDQAREQVSKLRDQLEDMLATWRTSFRPEKAEATSPADESDPAPQASTQAAAKKTTAAKKTPAEKPAASQGKKAS